MWPKTYGLQIQKNLSIMVFKIHQVIISFGFEMNLVDECIYHNLCGSKVISLVSDVDDILLASNDIGLLFIIKRILFRNFEMKDLDDAYFVLSTEIHKGDSQCILRLSQKNYIVKVFKMACRKINQEISLWIRKTSLVSIIVLIMINNKEIQKILYAPVTGSLMYAQVCTCLVLRT